MNYQANWQEKTKKLPEEIFSRLEHINNHPTLKRALLIGRGTELFIPDSKLFTPAAWKLFISGSDMPPNNSATPHDNLVYLKGEPITHLASLPAGIFDLIISLWDLSQQSSTNIPYINNIYRLLKKDGQFSIITCLDGSPGLPLDIIKRIISRKKLPLKIFKSALPDSPGSFRKMLNKTGFGDIRVWKDSIVCTYQSSQDLYNDIFSDGAGTLFSDNTSPEQRLIIKREFVNAAGKLSFPLKISYGFAGGVGVKP